MTAYIKSLKVQNFKAFDNFEIELNKFNVIIGPNAAGKSSFLNILKFIKDISTIGIENAIALQGGIEYLRNINIGNEKSLIISIEYEIEGGRRQIASSAKDLGMKFNTITYDLELKFHKRGTGYSIIKDDIELGCQYYHLEKDSDGEIVETRLYGEGYIKFLHKKKAFEAHISSPEEVEIDREAIVPSFMLGFDQNFYGTFNFSRPLVLQEPLNYIPFNWGKYFSNVKYYDFDPKLPKRAMPITGKNELEEDGSNLSIMLKNIFSDKVKKRQFKNLIHDILPFVKELKFDQFSDKTIYFQIQEKSSKNYIPASLISDGTINVTALIVALFFSEENITIIEEPERNVHPGLLARIVSHMEEAANKKQLIITTHNPEFIKNTDLDNIILIKKCEKGFSHVSQPSGREDVKIFLENDLGLEDLFTQNLL